MAISTPLKERVLLYRHISGTEGSSLVLFFLTHWVVRFSILPQMKRRQYSEVAQLPVLTINVVMRPSFSTSQWPPLWWFAHSWSSVEKDSFLPDSPIKLVFCGLVTQCSHLQERLRWFQQVNLKEYEYWVLLQLCSIGFLHQYLTHIIADVIHPKTIPFTARDTLSVSWVQANQQLDVHPEGPPVLEF